MRSVYSDEASDMEVGAAQIGKLSEGQLCYDNPGVTGRVEGRPDSWFPASGNSPRVMVLSSFLTKSHVYLFSR
jgi:hypothetical protein